MRGFKLNFKGFTLFEMLLVLAIIATILVSLTGYLTTRMDESRRDRTVLQIEQILNAGMAYYINNSTWPSTIDDLRGGANPYLPSTATILNSWGQPYAVTSNSITGTFSVCTTITGTTRSPNSETTINTADVEASVIAGRLPLGYVVTGPVTNTCPAPPSSATPCTDTQCTVVSSVNIPGQNLNNARSINYAGIYHNGGCVPAPTCPTNMTPNIFVIPVSVTGNYLGDSSPIYPLTSFTAFAVPAAPHAATGMVNCLGTGTTNCTLTSASASGMYWRVCLAVATSEGSISVANNANWTANSGTVMAVTRCLPTGEPIGSGFQVFLPK